MKVIGKRLVDDSFGVGFDSQLKLATYEHEHIAFNSHNICQRRWHLVCLVNDLPELANAYASYEL
jgi:hypothetical protein